MVFCSFAYADQRYCIFPLETNRQRFRLATARFEVFNLASWETCELRRRTIEITEALAELPGIAEAHESSMTIPRSSMTRTFPVSKSSKAAISISTPWFMSPLVINNSSTPSSIQIRLAHDAALEIHIHVGNELLAGEDGHSLGAEVISVRGIALAD